MLNDPNMKEIVDEFVVESLDLCTELEDYIEQMDEDLSNSKAFETFGQIIDRIMGAAKSFQAERTSALCELGKTIGYKASQADSTQLREITVGCLQDLLEMLQGILNSIKEGKGEEIKQTNVEKFVERLRWLDTKFVGITRSSVAINESQENIDDLLEKLNL